MTIKYGCGQKKTCLVNVTVKNDKAPVAVCVSNLSVALMGLDTDNDGVNDQGYGTTLGQRPQLEKLFYLQQLPSALFVLSRSQ